MSTEYRPDRTDLDFDAQLDAFALAATEPPQIFAVIGDAYFTMTAAQAVRLGAALIDAAATDEPEPRSHVAMRAALSALGMGWGDPA